MVGLGMDSCLPQKVTEESDLSPKMSDLSSRGSEDMIDFHPVNMIRPDKYRRRSFDLLGSERNLRINEALGIPNPWKRKPPRGPHPMQYVSHEIIHSSGSRFTCFNANTGHDAYTKRAVLKVSESVVTLISYSAGNKAFWCSGLIFASFWDNGSLLYSVFTSATLVRPPSSYASSIRNFHRLGFTRGPPGEDDHCLVIDQKIHVYLRGGKLCEGTIITYDPHYNIAVVTFKSDHRLPCAELRPLDDSFAVKLIPGDVVIAVGRSMEKPFQIMAAPGRYSADCVDEKTKLTCLDLFTADCKITKCGIGGPIISCEGEVIGISFYAEHCTPFLPINIFLKWWSHHKVNRSHCRPSLGMKTANLHTADLGTLDQVRKLGISHGLIVEKVLSGSPAESCGLRPGDVVLKCSDTILVSPLQLFEIIWNMAGKTVEVAVLREGSYKNMKIEVKDITSANEFYQWPLPREYGRKRRKRVTDGS